MIKSDKLEDNEKLSLTSLHTPPDDVKGISGTQMFGQREWLDFDKLREAYVVSQVELIKTRLIKYNEATPEVIEAVKKLQTFEEIKQYLLSAKHIAVTSNLMAIIEGNGNLQVIDGIKVSGQLWINWAAKGTGFGQIVITGQEDGSIDCDAETMQRHFIRAVLLRMADEIIISG